MSSCGTQHGPERVKRFKSVYSEDHQGCLFGQVKLYIVDSACVSCSAGAAFDPDCLGHSPACTYNLVLHCRSYPQANGRASPPKGVQAQFYRNGSGPAKQQQQLQQSARAAPSASRASRGSLAPPAREEALPAAGNDEIYPAAGQLTSGGLHPAKIALRLLKALIAIDHNSHSRQPRSSIL